MNRIGRLNPNANKDPKDSQLESVKKENLVLKQMVEQLQQENKVLKDENGTLSFENDDLKDQLETIEDELTKDERHGRG